MQGTGNINYSLNKNDFYKIILGCFILFIPFYYIIVTISVLYIYTLRYSQYYFSNKPANYKLNKNVEHYFKSITYHSPFNIMKETYQDIGNNKYTGLSNVSYLLIIVSYVITLLIILQGVIRNFLYSIYVNIIQINSNNNPYNNPNNVSKIPESAAISITQNYTTIITLSLVFLIPFLIPFVIRIFKFDNYDIKHNTWFSYILLGFIFAPLIIILSCYSYFNKNLSIFGNLNRFLQVGDYSFVDYISNNFNFKIYSILPFILMILVYCYYLFVHVQIKQNTLKRKIIAYAILFLIVFVFLPTIILFFSFSLAFDNKTIEDNTNDDNDIINNIQKYGISSLYDLLVKYNYPCFPK